MNEEKFSIDQEDEILDILAALKEVEARKVVLVIPSNAKITKARFGLRKLKETADKLDKSLLIESIDEEVLALCLKYDIRSVNPLFSPKRKIVADIVISHHKKKYLGKISPLLNFWNKKIALAVILILILGGGGVALASNFLPKAKISIVLKEHLWNYKGKISVNTHAAEVLKEELVIPGIIFSKNKNLTASFTPSGVKNISEKSKGKITIYNNFSKDKQILVATTRFEAPNGKIYRLDKRVVVPGMPGFIEANISADKPGEEYNSSPIDYLTIPGFKSSPRFNKFYGKVSGNITGGFIGTVPYPNNDDISKAKKETLELLRDNLRASLAIEMPQGIKILKEAEKFEPGEIVLDTKINETKKFSVTAGAKLNIFGFREDDLKGLMDHLMNKQLGFELEPIENEISYSDILPNFGNGFMTAGVNYRAKFTNKFDVGQFLSVVRGRNEKELENIILSYSDIDNATVAFTPFWVKNIPKEERKISVDLSH